MRGLRFCAPVVCCLPLTAALHAAESVGRVEGHARFERIKGQPQAGYVELYESNLFFCPVKSPPVGPSRRLGAPPGKPPRHDGFYPIDDVPAGRYSMLISQPLFFIRPKVVQDVVVKEGQTLELNPELPLEFSTYFRDKDQWTGGDTAWYQTFTAVGTSVTGVSVTFAGAGAAGMDVSILEDTGEKDVRRWKVLGTRRADKIGTNRDDWVRWRSGEIRLKPRRQYAVRVTGVGGDGRIQPYKRDKDKDSYRGGRAFNSQGHAQEFDLNYTVFGDTDGTMVTLCKRTPGNDELKSGYFAPKWGQTFIAKGKGLAGVDVFAAGAQNQWNIDFAWRIREEGPQGRQIGPVKTTQAAFQASGCGLHGVSYNRGEVPLKAGRTYFVEFEAVHPPEESPGFNPYITGDPYEGHGWQFKDGRWLERPDDDVTMTVMEYVK